MEIENPGEKMLQINSEKKKLKEENSGEENKEKLEKIHAETETLRVVYEKIKKIDSVFAEYKRALEDKNDEDMLIAEDRIKILIDKNEYDREFTKPPGVTIADPYGGSVMHDIKNIQARFIYYSLIKEDLNGGNIDEDLLYKWDRFAVNWKGYFYTMLDYAARAKGTLEGDPTKIEDRYLEKDFDLSECIDSLVEYIKISAETHEDQVNVAYDLAVPKNTKVTVAPGVFFNKLANIILNPVRKTRSIRARHVYVRAFVENEKCIFKIEDDGIGMTPEVQGQIFKDGFTTTGGKGIGLAHADEIFKHMGLDLMVESVSNIEGAGTGEVHTTFTIMIPLSA